MLRLQRMNFRMWIETHQLTALQVGFTSRNGNCARAATPASSAYRQRQRAEVGAASVGCRRRRQVWLSGAQTARIPRNSRAGKQRGRLPAPLGENRRELGEIEASWNERSRFPDARTVPPTASKQPCRTQCSSCARSSVSLEGSTYSKSPPTHAYGNSSACTHTVLVTCTCTCRSRNRMECICTYVCAVALSTRERGAIARSPPRGRVRAEGDAHDARSPCSARGVQCKET